MALLGAEGPWKSVTHKSGIVKGFLNGPPLLDIALNGDPKILWL